MELQILWPVGGPAVRAARSCAATLFHDTNLTVGRVREQTGKDFADQFVHCGAVVFVRDGLNVKRHNNDKGKGKRAR